MHNELTQIDLDKMKQELDYRRIELRPQLLEEVKEAESAETTQLDFPADA